MILKDAGLERFAKDTAGKRIVIFGAGVLCRVWLPCLLARCGLQDRVAFCVDNHRCGEQVELCGRAIPVRSFEYLRTHVEDDTVILISVAAFQDILRQIEACPALSRTVCHIAPMMFIEHHRGTEPETPLEGEAKIPKTIHYIWFSDHGERPPLMQACLESWRRFCPDYEIVEWNAENYDVTKNPDMYQAYREKKWSFVSDFARLDILYEHGGIYFDTDVELLRGIDPLLCQEAFVSFEKWPVVNSGGGMGAVKGFPLLREMMAYRAAAMRDQAGRGVRPLSSGFYESEPLIARGLRMDGRTQLVEGMRVYCHEYFHPFDYMSGKCAVTPNTYAVHHFNRSWVDAESLRNGSACYQAIRERMQGGA